MGLRYVSHDSIDKVKWDNCLDSCAHSLVYAYSWYLDAVADKWDALVLGDYKGVFPLVYREKYSIKYLYQPFFTQQLGLFLARDARNVSLDTFLNAVPKKFKLWEIQINGIHSSKDFDLKPRVTYQLDLNKSYSELEQGYSKDGRKSIKKAEAQSWELKDSQDIPMIIEDYRQAYGDINSGIQYSDYQRLTLLLERASENGKVDLLELVDGGGERMASAAFVKSKNTLHYILGAPTIEGRRRNATHVLIDKIVEKHSSSNMILDFEGSEIPSVAYFYQKFGSKPHTYFKLKVNKLPRFLRWLK